MLVIMSIGGYVGVIVMAIIRVVSGILGPGEPDFVWVKVGV